MKGEQVSAYLLKFATIIGIGKVMHKTPQMAHKEPTSLPAGVVGATSPYPGNVHCIFNTIGFRLYFVYHL